MSSDARSCYKELGVPFGASASEARKAYFRIARSCHPDKCSAPATVERFCRAKKALDVLLGFQDSGFQEVVQTTSGVDKACPDDTDLDYPEAKPTPPAKPASPPEPAEPEEPEPIMGLVELLEAVVMASVHVPFSSAFRRRVLQAGVSWPWGCAPSDLQAELLKVLRDELDQCVLQGDWPRLSKIDLAWWLKARGCDMQYALEDDSIDIGVLSRLCKQMVQQSTEESTFQATPLPTRSSFAVAKGADSHCKQNSSDKDLENSSPDEISENGNDKNLAESPAACDTSATAKSSRCKDKIVAETPAASNVSAKSQKSSESRDEIASNSVPACICRGICICRFIKRPSEPAQSAKVSKGGTLKQSGGSRTDAPAPDTSLVSKRISSQAKPAALPEDSALKPSAEPSSDVPVVAAPRVCLMQGQSSKPPRGIGSKRGSASGRAGSSKQTDSADLSPKKRKKVSSCDPEPNMVATAKDYATWLKASLERGKGKEGADFLMQKAKAGTVFRGKIMEVKLLQKVITKLVH